MKLAAVASAVALGTSLAIAFAGPAAAKDNQYLCAATADGEQCAYNTANVSTVTEPGGTVWDAPGSAGQISNVGSQPECLSVNTESTYNQVVMAACDGGHDEEWTAYNSGDGYTTYYDAWLGMCLNDRYYKNEVNAVTCSPGVSSNENEQWFPSQ